jgi:hypothetical protein
MAPTEYTRTAPGRIRESEQAPALAQWVTNGSGAYPATAPGLTAAPSGPTAALSPATLASRQSRDVGATAGGRQAGGRGRNGPEAPTGPESRRGLARVTPPAPRVLDNNTKSASGRVTGRAERYAMREALRGITGLSRVAKCGRCRYSFEGVQVLSRSDGGAHYGGLVQCGSVWCCPVCSLAVQTQRAHELAAGIRTHHAAGGGAVFLTLTARHGARDTLSHLRTAVQRGYSRLWAGRAGQAIRSRFGVVGNVRALEVTHGANGWHPHVHALVFTAVPLSPDELTALQAAVFSLWSTSLERSGYGKPLAVNCPAELVRPDADAMASYLVKLTSVATAHELATAGHKSAGGSSRTPWAILADAAAGDRESLVLWTRWEAGMKGARQLVWSRGLKAALGLVERTDEELAEDVPEDATLVLTIPPLTWWAVRRVQGLDARILTAAEAGGAVAVRELLALHGIRGGVGPPT